MSISAITQAQVTKDFDRRDLLVLRLNANVFEQLAILGRKELLPVEVNRKDALYVMQAFRNAGWHCTVIESQRKNYTSFMISH